MRFLLVLAAAWLAAPTPSAQLSRREQRGVAGAGEPARRELAGKRLAQAPWFDFVQTFNRGDGVEIGLDQRASESLPRRSVAVFVVHHDELDQFLAGRVHGRLSNEERVNILRQLTAAEGLDRYLHTRYVGQKRFSLEGGDALIPMLNDLVQQGGLAGIEEMIIGMAHRGRLNVLVNVLSEKRKNFDSEQRFKVNPLTQFIANNIDKYPKLMK